MTAIYATATVATGALGFEIVIYKPVSKIGGAAVFTRNPQIFPTIASTGTEILFDDNSTILWDDNSQILWDE